MKIGIIKDKFITYAALILSIILTFSLVGNISQAKRVRGEISDKKKEIEQLQNEAKLIQEKIDQAQKPEFIEKEIRNRLGLVKESEIVVVLPEESVLRSLSPKVPEDLEILPDPNWKKWVKLFI